MAIFRAQPSTSFGARIGISAIALAVALSACGGGDDDDGAGGTGGSAGAGGSGGSAGGGTDAGTVTWCSIKPIVNAKCALASGCHGLNKAAPIELKTYADTQQ